MTGPAESSSSRSTYESLKPDSETLHTLATADTAITGRKTWKTMKNDNEAVWPPAIEANLLKALEAYRPNTGGDPSRVLQRFPRRNRFISEYILKHTGKHRTAKQVGSRLQQLRDTCGDERIKKLIVHDPPASSVTHATPSGSKQSKSPPPLHIPSASPLLDTGSQLLVPEMEPFADSPLSQAATDSSSTSQLSSGWSDVSISQEGECQGRATSPSPATSHLHRAPRHTSVLIELYDENSSTSCSLPMKRSVDLEAGTDQRTLQLSGSIPPWTVQPTVGFVSPKLYSRSVRSTFTVSIDNEVVHTETTPVGLQSFGAPYLYRTEFVPGFWARLCMNSQLSRCLVSQNVIETALDEDGAPCDRPLLSVTYRFRDNTARSDILPLEESIQLTRECDLDFSHTSNEGHLFSHTASGSFPHYLEPDSSHHMPSGSFQSQWEYASLSSKDDLVPNHVTSPQHFWS